MLPLCRQTVNKMKMNQNIRFPKSSFFEFYCNEHRLTLAEYRSKRNHQKLDEFAEYYDDVAYDVVNQVFIVEKNGKLNFVDETKLEIVSVLYDFCHIYPGFAVVRKGNQVGNLFFHEGLSEPSSYRTVNVFEVKRGNYFGVETMSGDTLLDCVYRFVKVYPDFILAISDEGFSMFYLDGRRMFEDCFDEIDLTTIYHKHFYVQNNGQWGVVRVRGSWIVPALFRNKNDIILDLYAGNYHCCLNGKKGLYNRYGELIIPLEYDKIEFCSIPKSYIVTKNKKIGLIDHEGTIIFPCIYDKISFLRDNYYKISIERVNSIWKVPDNFRYPDILDFTVPAELETTSSCFDFYKLPWLCREMGDGFTDCDDYEEAIRWFLMYSVFNDYVCDQYYKKLTGKYKALTSKKSDELLSLFQLIVIRTGRTGKGCGFSSPYRLAEVYFEGKEVITNYRYAFELYIYCIEYMYIYDENGRTASFETKCEVLINKISQDEPVNVFDERWSDEYRQSALIAHRLGWMLYYGNGVEKDETMGMKLLDTAKTIGFIENQNFIYFPSEENDDEVCPF